VTHWRKRLIEDSLPLKEISAQAAREKSIRHGHISTLHIWWARRPLVACRAAIFAALVSAPKDEAERKELHEFLQELCTWEASNDGRIIEKAREYIRKQYPDAPPKVLDMFAGGGSIPLEAQRLGCESHAIDLNPVAHLIELCTLVYPQKVRRLL
jgi:putative DNA methylase